mmetsp:Transcript_30845/g.80825  ORF Transcript_30845/g.80825 Transcript_30845/m.80825 type:complete len:244 (-) Transcript_30845:455-1186(-)
MDGPNPASNDRQSREIVRSIGSTKVAMRVCASTSCHGTGTASSGSSKGRRLFSVRKTCCRSRGTPFFSEGFFLLRCFLLFLYETYATLFAVVIMPCRNGWIRSSASTQFESFAFSSSLLTRNHVSHHMSPTYRLARSNLPLIADFRMAHSTILFKCRVLAFSLPFSLSPSLARAAPKWSFTSVSNSIDASSPATSTSWKTSVEERRGHGRSMARAEQRQPRRIAAADGNDNARLCNTVSTTPP